MFQVLHLKIYIVCPHFRIQQTDDLKFKKKSFVKYHKETLKYSLFSFKRNNSM